MRHMLPICALLALLAGCDSQEQPAPAAAPATPAESEAPGVVEDGFESAAAQPAAEAAEVPVVEPRPEIYATVRLTSDLSHLSDNQRQMVARLIEASHLMDELFWRQAYGDPQPLLAELASEAQTYARYNYGPWDRLADNAPFVAGVGSKPEGANFYPTDMTKAEFEAAELADKDSLYTVLRRDADGQLTAIPYSQFWEAELTQAARLLREAAELADNDEFGAYLRLRADALLSNDYLASDMAWMDLKDNPIELVYGPIETYEDQLFGYKAAFESYVLIKDLEWSERLSRFAQFLPELQKGLPVEEKYKTEQPGSDADLNAYDVVFYAGDCNAGSKTIAINLPNDERVQLEKGTRRLQLKNAMRAKFDQILVPIADMLITEDQRQHITFDAFFGNTMFHEVAHGLGIKNTINDKGTVREALKEHASALEEGKADILGLYMITKLHEQGEIAEGELMDNYVTFLAGIFRSVRFGAASAHGRANMVRFNYFAERDAFSRDEATGRYRVNFEQMQQAMNDLSNEILVLQGEGDYAGVGKLLADHGNVSPALQADLDRLNTAGIPVDVVFEQGVDVLGLASEASGD